MTTILRHPIILWISRAILGFVFIVAAVEKVAQPEVFAASIIAYKILPVALVNIFALIVSWTELLSGILLITGYRVRASSAILTGLLVVFIVAILSAMARGMTIDCGCFGGAGGTTVGWFKILEDMGLLVLGLHLFFFAERQQDPL